MKTFRDFIKECRKQRVNLGRVFEILRPGPKADNRETIAFIESWIEKDPSKVMGAIQLIKESFYE